MDSPFYIEKLIQKAIKESRSKHDVSDDEFKKLMEKKVSSFAKKLSKKVIDEITKHCFSEENDLKKREKEVTEKISNRYGYSIKLFEGFIELNNQIGFITYNKYYKLFDTYDDHLKLDTLTALHVRACQIMNEILVLFKNGFADGAHARWRTLHELAVTFLYLYDSDYDVIQMYNDFEIIEKYKKALDYRNSYESLGFDRMDENDWLELNNVRNKLIQKYGKEFSENYGWTLKDLPKGKRNFRELEKLVGISDLRVIYTWANENIHASVSGIKEKISLIDEESYHFLPGPNDWGFLDPVQYTTSSLCQMSEVLLEMEDSIMNRLLEEILFLFQNEIVVELSTAEDQNL